LFGLNNVMTIPFFLWAFRRQRNFSRWIWLGGLGLALACIMLTNTRAILVLTALTLAFLHPTARGQECVHRARAHRSDGGALHPGRLYRRSLDLSLYTTERGDSIRVRFKFWAKSWELIQDTWTHGIGVGDETTLQRMITDEDTGYLSTVGLKASAHNEYIWVMVELGLAGYVLFWGFVAAVTRAAFQAAALIRKAAGSTEQYHFMVACQTLMIGVLLFAVQSEEFHYPLKGWWLIAAVSCSMLAAVRPSAAPRQVEAAAS